MAKYDDFKKKAMDALGTIADVSAEAYRVAEEKTRILAKKAKLNTEIAREKALIRRLKGDIGAKYYELHKDDPEEDLKLGCDGVTASLVRIAQKRKELEELKELKNKESCCDCDAACDAECEPAPEEEKDE